MFSQIFLKMALLLTENLKQVLGQGSSARAKCRHLQSMGWKPLRTLSVFISRKGRSMAPSKVLAPSLTRDRICGIVYTWKIWSTM